MVVPCDTFGERPMFIYVEPAKSGGARALDRMNPINAFATLCSTKVLYVDYPICWATWAMALALPLKRMRCQDMV